MNLEDIRRFNRALLQRPIGRLAALLLAIVIVFAGMPIEQVHAHAHGDTYHSAGAHTAFDDDHHSGESAFPQHGSEDAASNSSADQIVLHLHDVGATVAALIPQIPVVLHDLPPATPTLDLAVETPPTVILVPLYRPPIV